jgi:ABC-type transporter Mla MlaB component
MDHSLKVTKTEAGKEGTLSLTGDLTMAEVHETKKALLGAIGEVDILRLDLREIESADVSFVQLLCAAHRECFLTDKEFLLDDGVGNILATLLERAGYLKQCGCFPGAQKSCLWSTCSFSH